MGFFTVPYEYQPMSCHMVMSVLNIHCHVLYVMYTILTISPKKIRILTTEFSPGLKLFSMNLFLVILILKHFLAKKKVLKNLFLLPIHTICKATENTVCTNTELKNNVCMFL